MEETILILGASLTFVEIIEKAKKKGFNTVVTDYAPNKDIETMADKVFNIDLVDTEKLVALAKEINPNGVVAPFTDIGQLAACEVAKALGISDYLRLEAARTLVDKMKMKELFSAFGIPISPYQIVDTDEIQEMDINLKLPVIVKPIVAAANRGISIVYDKASIEKAVTKASAWNVNKSSKVVIEQYIDGLEYEVPGWIADGIAYPLTVNIKHRDVQKDGIVPIAYCTQSKQELPFYQDMLQVLQKIPPSLGIKDGPFLFQFIAKDNQIFVLEFMHRPGGALSHRFPIYEGGPDTVSMLLDISVGRRVDSNRLIHSEPFLSKKYASINIITHPGKIGEISGIEKIRSLPWVKEASLLYSVGATISNDLNMRRNVCRIFAELDEFPSYKEALNVLNNMISIKDENMEEMVIR